jgi:hypothetical protein
MVPRRLAIGYHSPQEVDMCLTCGCMQAHLEMGEHNIVYEDVKRAADENGRTVEETLDIIARTADTDRADHPDEYLTGSGA